jgi:DNA (cytosine-5)-methyltransferase 1
MQKLRKSSLPDHAIIDLFCGIGGLSYGLKLEKLNLIAGIDYDTTCKYAFEANNRTAFLQKDLLVTHSNEIKNLYPETGIKILVGCAPCQAFSALSHKYKQNDKWKMLYSFSRFIKEIKPEIISMENVPQLVTYNGGKVFQDFVDTLKAAKYHVSYSVVNAADYGVPQKRNRLILLASKLGPIQLIGKTHHPGKYVTVKKAIGHLPPIEDGEIYEKDILHRARKLTPLNKERIISTPLGGGWKDWDKSLILECHKKESGKSFRSVYGRMKWDEPSPTITTQCTGLGNGRFGHPEQHRAISIREAAILQSFPVNFKFLPKKSTINTSALQRHVGNAVPVLLGRAIGKSIKQHLSHV